jgi:hypothetical protein
LVRSCCIYLTCTKSHVGTGFYIDSFKIVASGSGIVALSDDVLDALSGGNQAFDEVVAGGRTRRPLLPRTVD